MPWIDEDSKHLAAYFWLWFSTAIATKMRGFISRSAIPQYGPQEQDR